MASMNGDDSAQQQLDEFECMLSMFSGDDELRVDTEATQILENCVAEGRRPDCPTNYTLFYKDLAFNRAVPTLTLTCPPGYPGVEAMKFEVQCPHLFRMEMEKLNAEMLELTTAASAAQEVVALQLYQQMHEFLSQVQLNRSVDEIQDEETKTETLPEKVVLGRRAIYFHHIIASNKRRVVKEWAAELQLGGFSKIGWPGVVIVEGAESNAQEYVRRLQHLRWKQITVRGEQTEETDNCAMRRLPHSFHEFPEDGMSKLAAACRAAGLEDLFLTTMKIYGRAGDAAKV